jgi:hypothetical protein
VISEAQTTRLNKPDALGFEALLLLAPACAAASADPTLSVDDAVPGDRGIIRHGMQGVPDLPCLADESSSFGDLAVRCDPTDGDSSDDVVDQLIARATAGMAD